MRRECHPGDLVVAARQHGGRGGRDAREGQDRGGLAGLGHFSSSFFLYVTFMEFIVAQ